MELDTVDKRTLLALAQALWSWDECVHCTQHELCGSSRCPESRLKKLGRFAEYYESLVSLYSDDNPGANRALKTSDDLHRAIRKIKENPEITQRELYLNIKDASSSPEQVTDDDAAQAVALVVQVFFMINCSPLHFPSSSRLEAGHGRRPWGKDESFTKYLENVFSLKEQPPAQKIPDDINLTAAELQKKLKVTILPVHEITNHLRLDRKLQTLEIYHHTAFIKEQLCATKDAGEFTSMSSSIAMGALPRPLLLEILDSLQLILFPPSDLKSLQVRDELVRNQNLDPDIRRYEFTALRNPGEEHTISYVYLAGRLSELLNEMREPRPKGRIGKWMQHVSAPRHIMIVTLIGVGVAVLLGFLSLGLSCFQSWVAYQAWKHPVTAIP